MKLPRDLSARDLIKSLSKLGYEVVNQTGSHIRMTTQINGEHHLTIPNHDFIKIGLLSSILKSIAAHHNLTRDELIQKLNL